MNREKEILLQLLMEKYGTKEQANVEVWQQLKNQNGPVQDQENKPVVKPVKAIKTRKRILSVSRKHWKIEDLHMLVELSGNYSPDQIAAIMKRTKPAIYRMQGNLRWGHCDSRLVHEFRAGKDFSKLGNSQNHL